MPKTRIDHSAEARRYAVVDRRLGKLQAIHAGALIGISSIGSLALIPFSLVFGVRVIDVALLLSLYVLTLLGGTIGFHRLYSHQAFTAPVGVRLALGVFASMAAQGPLNYWVANHRRHHWDSDGALDPHSPHRFREKRFGRWEGLFHAHFGWAFIPEFTNGLRFGNGLAEDPVARFVNRTYFVWVALGLIVPAVIGGLWSSSVQGAIAGFLWGGLLRIFLVFNAASLVNSVCHVHGYAPYSVPNQSRNIWWLSLVTLGEAWHNNHHAFSKSAYFGHHWWQIDVGGLVIRLMASVGLVTNVSAPVKDKFLERIQRDEH